MLLIREILLLMLFGLANSKKSCECMKSGDSRIIGGQEADAHEYPWQAFIVSKFKNKQYLCGGTLIGKRWILSAAHCFVKKLKRKIVHIKPRNIIIRLGEHNFKEDKETKFTTTVYAAKIIVHEDYKPPKHDNDIALIKIKGQVQFSDYISPACVPQGYEDYYFQGENVTVTGWGYINLKGDFSFTLKEVGLTLYEVEECLAMTAYELNLSDNMICAYAVGSDACMGDSGGPAIWRKDDYNFVVGIVSWGRGCGTANVPGVYVKVVQYIDWIADKTKDSFCSLADNTLLDYEDYESNY